MSKADSDVMGTREAAKTLGVSVRTVQLWVESGALTAWKTPGKHRRILRSSVDALLAQRSADTGEDDDAGGDILIVEDELTMLAYYQALFELIRPETPLRFANDGFAGLVEFGRRTPKLMLVDIDMPGMDGIEMIRSLHATLPDGVGVVVVSGLSSEQVDERGGLPGDIPVYAKPLSADALQEILASNFASDEKQTEGATDEHG